MRPIKFRAWDKERNRMMDIGNIRFLSEGKPMVWERNVSAGISMSKVELMQFTGLLDKNGKEIYEGDCFEVLSRSTEHKGQRKGIAWVVWSDGELGWRLSDTLKSGEYNIHWFAKNAPVLGNIYENPELLR